MPGKSMAGDTPPMREHHIRAIGRLNTETKRALGVAQSEGVVAYTHVG